MASEKRLIDANELKSRMFNYYGCVNEHTSKSTYTGETLMDYEVADLIEDCIDGANTVDAVEVVRCCKCVYWEQLRAGTIGRCNKTVAYTNCAHFCSYGERRGGE